MSTSALCVKTNEDILIDKAIKGDLDAFNHLVKAYQDIAYHHAWTFLKDQFLAEDVTQESFIKAFKSISRFRKGSFRAWLLRIVTNTSLDAIRKNKRHHFLPLFPEDDDGFVDENPKWLADTSPSVEKTIETKETGLEIYRLLDELPKIYREVLTLVDIYDFQYKEAAQVLNLKIGTVKSRLMRARLQMRKKLKFNADFRANANPQGTSQANTNKNKYTPRRRFRYSHT